VKGDLLANVELRRKRKDGTSIDFLLSTAPMFDAQGKVVAYLGVMNDISERIRTEEALKQSESRYRRLVGAVTDFICCVEIVEGRLVRASYGAGCEAVTGYTSGELQRDRNRWLQMVYAEDRPAAVALAESLFRGEAPLVFDFRIVRKDKLIRWVRCTPVCRSDTDRRFIALDILVSDITERKRAEAALIEERHLLHTLMDNLPDLIYF
jgi:PAS domain S-box-containing protein